MTQGQGPSTPDKERKLGAMFDMQGNLYLKINALFYGPAYHIDLNAGCGHNHAFNEPGSPIVFLDVMRARYPSVPFRAWFIDRDVAAINELKDRVANRYGHLDNVSIMCADNRDALIQIAPQLEPHWATGSVLADPNGWLSRNKKDKSGVPVEELKQFAHLFRRMDLLMNLNVRSYRLQSGCDYETYSAPEFGALFMRSHWLITRAAHNEHSTFICLMGRNLKTSGYKKYDWYEMNSPTGLDILNGLEISKRHFGPQNGTLFDEIT
jgi:hypothetical protein